MRASKTWVNLIGLLLLAVLGLAESAFAQPQVTRGGALKRRQYQTYAAATYYVDPTGNDANACTASGTSACATLAGAVNKLPRFIRHNVTVNVAAGAYGTGLPTFSGLSIGIGITLTVTGTMSTFVPSTGTASGTSTGSTAGSNTGPATLTDSGQSWAVNNLKGAFITLASGFYAGERIPIAANTATTLSLPLNVAPGTGVAYSIVQPGSTFNSTSVTNVQGLEGGGTLALTNLQIRRTGGTNLSINSGQPTVSVVSCDLGSTASGGILFSGSGRLTAQNLYLNVVQTAINNSSTTKPPGIVSVSASVLVSSSGIGYFQNTTGSVSSIGVSSSVVEGGSTVTPLVTYGVAVGPQSGLLWITCTGGAGSVGLGVLAPSGSVAYPLSAISSNTGTRITGCEIGVNLVGKAAQWTMNAPAFDTVTTAFSVRKGATMDFVGSTPTFTSVTNELQLDNSDNFTFSTLSSLPTPQVISNSYGSTFIR